MNLKLPTHEIPIRHGAGSKGNQESIKTPLIWRLLEWRASLTGQNGSRRPRNLGPWRFSRSQNREQEGQTRWIGYLAVLAPVLLLTLPGLLGGCGANPEDLLPNVDPLASLPDNRQSDLLPADVVFPVSGPVGTEIKVHGQGRVFPRGFAKFVFQGNATAEVELLDITSEIRVRIPHGTESGPFGFTIAGRSSGRDDLSLITSDSNLFAAYTISAPGFRVTEPPVDRNSI